MSNQRNDSRFVKYKLSEVAGKLATFIRDQKKIRLWKSGSAPFFANLIDIKKSGLIFRINKSPKYEIKSEDTILINFSFNDLDYFVKGSIQSIEDEQILVSVTADVFKAERRHNERVLAYPHLDVHAYLSVQKNNSLDPVSKESNVLSFERPIVGEKDNLKSFLSSKTSEELPESWLNDESDVELQGFRIMDISCVGLSFCASVEEDEELFQGSEGKIWDIYILFEGDAITLSDASYVYSIDYVNPQASVVPMKKIGMKFDDSIELSAKIYSYIDESNITSELEKDFENLIQ